MKKSNSLILNSPSKYNPNTGRWTVYIPNIVLVDLYKTVEQYCYFGEMKPNEVFENRNLFEYMEFAYLKTLIPLLRRSALKAKNQIILSKLDAIILSRIDTPAKHFLNKMA